MVFLSLQFIPSLPGVPDPTSEFVVCICATDPYCQAPAGYGDRIILGPFDSEVRVQLIPGFIRACSVLNSLLLSTLECFYSSTDCLSSLTNYMNQSYVRVDTHVPWFDPKPLVYDALTSRFVPNNSLSVIIKQMLLEEWHPTVAFDRYYEACAPRHCTFTYTTRTNGFVQVTIKMVSMLGGLIVMLRLISPYLVKCVLYLLKPKVGRRDEGND